MIKILSKISGLLLFFSLVIAGRLAAQENEINQDDLRKYALLNEVIDLMKKDLSAEVNNMIKSQEGMTGQRYKELAATDGDETKLSEIEAKDYEVQFLKLVNDLKAERIEAIKLINQELATKMVGDRGKTYKNIKSALNSDSALKEQYDGIVALLKNEDNID